MPISQTPGVYIEEGAGGPPKIERVATSIAGFIGLGRQQTQPAALRSFAEFEGLIGANAHGFLALAVRGFFENGGSLCRAVCLAANDPLEIGLEMLAAEDVLIVCCPDEPQFPNAAALLAGHCEQFRNRICILQSPRPVVPDAAHVVPVHSAYAAYYHPWIAVAGLAGAAPVTIPPGGHVAGVMARREIQNGLSRATANTPVVGVTALSQEISDASSEALTAKGINTLRSFPGKGVLVWGSRTTSEDPEWKYVHIRRLVIFVESSVERGLQWVVFEPNGPKLWANVRAAVTNFLIDVWRSGELQGSKPEEAFFVKCDRSAMTQDDIDSGRLIALVGIAPIKPAEFVILRISMLTQNGAAGSGAS